MILSNKKILASIFMMSACFASRNVMARVIEIVTIDQDRREALADVPVYARVWGADNVCLKYTRVTDANGHVMINKKKVNNLNVCVLADSKHYCTSDMIFRLPDDESAVVVTMSVCKVEHPVLLKVEDVRLDFAREIQCAQFDFLIGDWLPPFGTGVVADVEFMPQPRVYTGMGRRAACQKTEERKKDELLVRFPGKGNGIQCVPCVKECQLHVRLAPESGYEQLYTSFWYEDEKLEEVCSWEDFKCLCFRIRARADESGNVTSAYYGKLDGDVVLRISYQTPPYIKGMKFRYYVNRTEGDRNLEHDVRNDPNRHSMLRLRP